MIKKFNCHNFRNVNTENLEFDRINILIGPNNSGKSNFIKSLTFFSDMLKQANNGNLKSAFLNSVSRNGWDHMVNKSVDKRTPIDFSWEIELGNEPVCYKFSFEVGNIVQDCNIILEELDSMRTYDKYLKEFNYFSCHNDSIGEGHFSTATQKGKRNKRLTFSVNPKETIVMQFKDILLENKTLYVDDTIRVEIANLLYKIQKYFEGFNIYSSSQFNTSKLRNPVEIKNVDRRLLPDGTNFVNIFNNYKTENIFWKTDFEEKIKELIPTLQTVDTVVIYDKLLLKLAYDNEQYDLSDISEGTLKALILNLLINMEMSEQCPLLAIDEPETNLHPAWQKVVGKWIQTSNTFKQCFISTHSPDFLDSFTESFKQGKVSVFVFGNIGDSLIKRIRYEDIADDLGDWELGDLYRVNDPALGGWPW